MQRRRAMRIMKVDVGTGAKARSTVPIICHCQVASRRLATFSLSPLPTSHRLSALGHTISTPTTREYYLLLFTSARKPLGPTALSRSNRWNAATAGVNVPQVNVPAKRTVVAVASGALATKTPTSPWEARPSHRRVARTIRCWRQIRECRHRCCPLRRSIRTS
jgi:hypothetical protein